MIEGQIEIKPGSKMVFRSTDSGERHNEPFDVVVLRTLSDDECDTSDVGYMYEVQFLDGHTEHAFHDEVLPYTKLEAYKAGKYQFKCPSVTPRLWNDQDWINWIDASNGWTVEVV